MNKTQKIGQGTQNRHRTQNNIQRRKQKAEQKTEKST